MQAVTQNRIPTDTETRCDRGLYTGRQTKRQKAKKKNLSSVFSLFLNNFPGTTAPQW